MKIKMFMAVKFLVNLKQLGRHRKSTRLATQLPATRPK